MHYRRNNNITSPTYVTQEQAMSFFYLSISRKTYKYGVIAVARSAVSVILPLKEGKTFGECQKVSKMLVKSKLRPTFPKYIVIYNPDIVLKYMGILSNNSSLLLRDRTKKLFTLRCLLCNSLTIAYDNNSLIRPNL